MSVILSIETSGDACSVAIHNRGELIAWESIREPQAHAAKLAVLIDTTLKKSGVDFQKLGALALTSGPGSYTGLRIGTSTAKGLCYALNIPLIAVGTLELLVHQGLKLRTGLMLCPMIDARRMEVYAMIADGGGAILRNIEAEVVDSTSYQSFLEKGSVLFFGNGAAKCQSVITHPNARFELKINPDVRALGELAIRKFETQQFEDIVHFEPFYLKEFQVKKSTRPLF